MRRHLVLLLALTGCKYLDQPKKVAELEKRLDEVSSKLTEMTGEPVGQKPGAKAHEDEDEDEDGKKAKGKKGKGKDEKSARGSKARDGKDAKVASKKRHEDEDEDKGKDEDEDEDARDDRDRDDDDEHAADAAPPAELKPAAHVHWGYEEADGPESWAKLDPAFATCSKGEHQSPIDILPRRASAPEVIFVYHPSAGTVVDNGHTLQVDLAPGSFIVVDGTRFDLVQFHVHTPSEHTVAGDSFPMELHLVHKSKAGALAVIGVLYTEGETSTALAPIWKGAPKAAGSSKLKKTFDPDALLPKDRSAYRYDGSLTTPPCAEGVIWHVLRRPRTEDDRTIAAFRRRFGANARPAQELHDRELR